MNEMLETLGRNAKEAEIVLRNLDTAKKIRFWRLLQTALLQIRKHFLQQMPLM